MRNLIVYPFFLTHSHVSVNASLFHILYSISILQVGASGTLRLQKLPIYAIELNGRMAKKKTTDEKLNER